MTAVKAPSGGIPTVPDATLKHTDPHAMQTTPHESSIERLSGALALCCAIAVFLAATFDLERDAPPAVGKVVQGTK